MGTEEMLVLSRKEKQEILIGEDIELLVVAVRGQRVQLGFNAPNGVTILREEVYQRIPSNALDAQPPLGNCSERD
jgi:carbon storage regulator